MKINSKILEIFFFSLINIILSDDTGVADISSTYSEDFYHVFLKNDSAYGFLTSDAAYEASTDSASQIISITSSSGFSKYSTFAFIEDQSYYLNNNNIIIIIF